MKVKVHKSDIIIALLVVVYVLGQNILYLVPVNNNYNLIAYIMLALLAGYAICVGNGLKLKKRFYATNAFTICTFTSCCCG